jgi:hypothetical protein
MIPRAAIQGAAKRSAFHGLANPDALSLRWFGGSMREFLGWEIWFDIPAQPSRWDESSFTTHTRSWKLRAIVNCPLRGNPK